MKHFVLWAFALFAFCACSNGSEAMPEPETPSNTNEEENEKLSFSVEESSYAGTLLPYRKAAISGNEEKAALVLYLHGGTSKGSNNNAPIAEKGVSMIGDYLSSHHIHSIFIVPQCAKDKSWGGSMNEVLKSLIDEHIASGLVNSNRIFIFGGSMGGTGTWSMLSAYPGLFAAAMPVAGNPAGCNASNLSRTPILTVMGTADKIMSIGNVESVIEQINNLGGTALLETEDGWSHETTCTDSYTTGRLDWIFKY